MLFSYFPILFLTFVLASEGVAVIFMQPSESVFCYELDFSYCRRAVRNGLYILPRQGEGFRGCPMVGVDFSVWSVVCFERSAFGKGGARHFGWRCLSYLDRNWRGGRSANFALCVQRAGFVLENILPHHAYRLGGWAKKCGIDAQKCVKFLILLHAPRIHRSDGDMQSVVFYVGIFVVGEKKKIGAFGQFVGKQKAGDFACARFI